MIHCFIFKKIEIKSKMNKLGIVLLLCVAVSLGQSKPAAGGKWKCNDEDKKKIDAIVARVMTYGRSDRKFPSNSADLKAYCK